MRKKLAALTFAVFMLLSACSGGPGENEPDFKSFYSEKRNAMIGLGMEKADVEALLGEGKEVFNGFMYNNNEISVSYDSGDAVTGILVFSGDWKTSTGERLGTKEKDFSGIVLANPNFAGGKNIYSVYYSKAGKALELKEESFYSVTVFVMDGDTLKEMYIAVK